MAFVTETTVIAQIKRLLIATFSDFRLQAAVFMMQHGEPLDSMPGLNCNRQKKSRLRAVTRSIANVSLWSIEGPGQWIEFDRISALLEKGGQNR